MSKHVSRDHLFSNGVYDWLRHISQITLPAVGTLYFAIAQIWGFPNGEEVVGTIIAVDAFMGLLLSVSSKTYKNSEAKYDGSIDVEQQEDDTKLFSLSLNSDPEELETKTEVVFKVNPSQPS